MMMIGTFCFGGALGWLGTYTGVAIFLGGLVRLADYYWSGKELQREPRSFYNDELPIYPDN